MSLKLKDIFKRMRSHYDASKKEKRLVYSFVGRVGDLVEDLDEHSLIVNKAIERVN